MTTFDTSPAPQHAGEDRRVANASRARLVINEALARPVGDEPGIVAALLMAQDAIAGLEVLVTQLRTALNTRIVIEQAKGLRMAHGFTADEAFAELVAISQRTNRKVGAVAAEIVQNAESASLGIRRIGGQRPGAGD